MHHKSSRAPKNYVLTNQSLSQSNDFFILGRLRRQALHQPHRPFRPAHNLHSLAPTCRPQCQCAIRGQPHKLLTVRCQPRNEDPRMAVRYSQLHANQLQAALGPLHSGVEQREQTSWLVILNPMSRWPMRTWRCLQSNVGAPQSSSRMRKIPAPAPQPLVDPSWPA